MLFRPQYFSRNNNGGCGIVDDDDSSSHSTMEVDVLPKKPLNVIVEEGYEDDDDTCSLTSMESTSTVFTKSASSSSLSSLKSVAFDLDSNEEYDNVGWCFEDCADSWYARGDYAAFRSSTKVEARRAYRSPDHVSYERAVSHAYDCCRDRGSVIEPPHGVVLSDDEKAQLWRFAGEGPTCRTGLEKWLVPSVRRQMSSRKADVVDAVLALQMMSAARMVCDDVAADDDYDGTDLLRQCAEQISRANRLFARANAEALASAISAGDFWCEI